MPFIVVTVEYKGNPAKQQVQVWSLFLTIGWAVACVTSVIVDFLPHLFGQSLASTQSWRPRSSD